METIKIVAHIFFGGYIIALAVSFVVSLGTSGLYIFSHLKEAFVWSGYLPLAIVTIAMFMLPGVILGIV